ncbi:MAG: trigger factor [Kiritimatiellia bacterium]
MADNDTMEVNVQDEKKCRRVVNVKVPPESVSSDYTDVVKAYAGAVKVPGFRKGKAPADVVERRYGKEIEEEARDRLVPRFYREALSRENIKPVSIVEVGDVSFGKDKGLSFKVTVDVPPEFKLPRYRKISLRGQDVNVSDEDVDAAIKRVRESAASFEDVSDRPAKRGDMIMIDYKGFFEGRPVNEVVLGCNDLGEAEDFRMLLDEPEVMPGFLEGLAGASAGDEKVIEVKFPPDYHVRDAAGRKAEYTVRVKAVREKRLPEMNEEFFRYFNVSSEEELRSRVRKELEDAAHTRERDRLKEEIARHLLEKADVEAPESLVEEETRAAVMDLVRRMRMQGAGDEQIESESKTILDESRKKSEDRVRLSFILSRIAEEENIRVDSAEVDKQVEAMAGRRGVSVERLRSELAGKGGLERIEDQLLAGNVLDFVLEQARVKK